MGIQWTVLTHWTQNWKLFSKICTQSWEKCKNLPKNSNFEEIGEFYHVLSFFSSLGAYFWKQFSVLCSVSQDSSFGTHQPYIWDKKYLTPRRGPQKFQGVSASVAPLNYDQIQQYFRIGFSAIEGPCKLIYRKNIDIIGRACTLIHV